MEYPYANFDLENDWIGVDFDGTVHVRDRSKPFTELGPPVPVMVERIKAWRQRGMTVKILTARVSDRPIKNLAEADVPAYVARQRKILDEWCLKHIGETFPITASKDAYMYHLWDDRGVCVERNTGVVLGINPEW